MVEATISMKAARILALLRGPGTSFRRVSDRVAVISFDPARSNVLTQARAPGFPAKDRAALEAATGGGSWRLNLRQERVRRRRDAAEQPRTRRGTFDRLRYARPRRIPLDDESRRYWQEEDYELSMHEIGLRSQLEQLDVEKRSDRLDGGNVISYRARARSHAKRYNAFGGLTAPTDVLAGNREHLERNRRERAAIRDEIAEVRRRRRQIADTLVYGETRSGAFRRRKGPSRPRASWAKRHPRLARFGPLGAGGVLLAEGSHRRRRRR